MICCKLGLKDLAEFLLCNKANVNESNILGDTPLKIAQKNGFEDLAFLLVQRYKAPLRPLSKK
jgi:ankyrin repeat protein